MESTGISSHVYGYFRRVINRKKIRLVFFRSMCVKDIKLKPQYILSHIHPVTCKLPKGGWERRICMSSTVWIWRSSLSKYFQDGVQLVAGRGLLNSVVRRRRVVKASGVLKLSFWHKQALLNPLNHPRKIMK